jgi:DNA polymerase-3 subunit epsilon
MRREPDREYDRQTAAQWAAGLLQRQDWVLFDTETTGLTLSAEIVQVGVLGPAGEVLMDTLVRPLGRIEKEAQAVHGISNEQAATGRPFSVVYRELCEIFKGRQVIIYNADFDRRMLFQCAGRHNVEYVSIVTDCAMRQYAKWYGDWNAARGSYRWQRLEGGDHSALGDARATLELIKKMAASYNPAVLATRPRGVVLG